MVPPGGIEPPTRGFSVPCSTDWATEAFLQRLFSILYSLRNVNNFFQKFLYSWVARVKLTQIDRRFLGIVYIIHNAFTFYALSALFWGNLRYFKHANKEWLFSPLLKWENMRFWRLIPAAAYTVRTLYWRLPSWEPCVDSYWSSPARQRSVLPSPWRSQYLLETIAGLDD